MASTFRLPRAPFGMCSPSSYAAGLASGGLSEVCELPLAQLNAGPETAPEVAAG